MVWRTFSISSSFPCNVCAKNDVVEIDELFFVEGLTKDTKQVTRFRTGLLVEYQYPLSLSAFWRRQPVILESRKETLKLHAKPG